MKTFMQSIESMYNSPTFTLLSIRPKHSEIMHQVRNDNGIYLKNENSFEEYPPFEDNKGNYFYFRLASTMDWNFKTDRIDATLKFVFVLYCNEDLKSIKNAVLNAFKEHLNNFLSDEKITLDIRSRNVYESETGKNDSLRHHVFMFSIQAKMHWFEYFNSICEPEIKCNKCP